ncbi:tetratricopeptide repeat protein [Candidatus Woesebacteria bacterium]|nr:tetratricopeptide repeat protein [Candidatus Woesebacteria bacterium]
MNTTPLQSLEDQAVDAAIKGDWAEAVNLNSEILKKHKESIPSLLRLGFAYLQLKNYDRSLSIYKRVLKIQPQNAIAGDYIEKIELRKKDTRKTGNVVSVVLDSNIFIELPGKTKAVTLSQLGQKSALAQLMIGEEVYLIVRKHHVEVRIASDEYVGVLPDDVGVRLMYFLENQSEYKVYIQEATLSNVIVFIREISKGKKVEKLVSFPVDIPGSISKVISYQQKQKDDEQRDEKPENPEAKIAQKEAQEEDGESDDEKDDDVLGNELLKDIEGDQKPESEILGIETDEEEEEE